jgi:hypothetical protein
VRARAAYLFEALLLVQHTQYFHLPFAYRFTNKNIVDARRAASSKAAAASTKAAAAVHSSPPSSADRFS